MNNQGNQQEQMNEMFMALAQEPIKTMQALAQQGIDQKQILQLVQQQAQAGNPAAQEAMKAIQDQAQMAKHGAKLQYVKRLYGQCPEGYEMKMFKVGGQICKKCEKLAQETTVSDENPILAKFRAFRCGGKATKKETKAKKACGGLKVRI